MKVNIDSKIAIAASCRDVFKYLTDLQYAKLWNPQMSYISSTKILKRSTTYEATSRVLGLEVKAKNTVTKFRQDKELQIDNMTGSFQYSVHFKLVPTSNDSTQVVCTTSVWSENKAFAFAGPVLKALAIRELQADLKALKSIIEKRDTTPAIA